MGTTPNLPPPSTAFEVRHSNFASVLFTDTQQRVLGYLFGQPERSFYAKELIKLTGSGSGAIQRELRRLEQSGLVATHWQGNQKHYQANPASPIFQELCSIAQKTFGLAQPIRDSLRSLAGGIEVAFIYGSVAKHSESAASDIDLFVMSDGLSYAELMAVLTSAEQTLARRINPTLYTRAEFLRRQQQANVFLRRLLEQPKIWLKGGPDDLSA